MMRRKPKPHPAPVVRVRVCPVCGDPFDTTRDYDAPCGDCRTEPTRPAPPQATADEDAHRPSEGDR